MMLGFLVAVLPYAGIPYDFAKWIWTVAGLLVIFLVFFSRRSRPRAGDTVTHIEKSSDTEAPRALHVKRTEVEDRPQMQVERGVTIDTETTDESSDRETSIERKITVVRRRKKKNVPNLPEQPEIEGIPGV